ncbi:hypothetical protein SAMN05444671_2547 [Flavobacterium sp. CF108]|uniref:hypothetical protein n=1 Tax=unclassified Flavobacterium TaxID=196869 RepID=UPI0008C882E6|nr:MULTISPECIES: hypothetical protein [unclassified Flavobacterium]SEN95366.1 hypothetical protein SAMN04487978_1863 [Flavobacterium sp. fv08]SHH29567.1 hypothetical protein SAMN05444671_2547 [Flavobacterium sp. CF108]
MKKYLLLLILIVFSSCHDNDDNRSDENRLEGKWSWIRTSGGFGGPTSSETSDQKIVIEISNSTIKTYINGNLSQQQKFFIITKKSVFGGDRKMIVIDKGDSITQDFYLDRSFEFHNNKLYLIDECVDCSTSEYERVK